MNKWQLWILLLLVSSATIIEAQRRKHREPNDDDLIHPRRDSPMRRRHERINPLLHDLYDTDNTEDLSTVPMRRTAALRSRKHISQPYQREQLDNMDDFLENPRKFENRRRVTAANRLRGKTKTAAMSLSARGKTKQMPRSDEMWERPKVKAERANLQHFRSGRGRDRLSISEEIEKDIFFPHLTQAEHDLAKWNRKDRYVNKPQIEESSTTGKGIKGKFKTSATGKRQGKSKSSAAGKRQGSSQSSVPEKGQGKSMSAPKKGQGKSKSSAKGKQEKAQSITKMNGNRKSKPKTVSKATKSSKSLLKGKTSSVNATQPEDSPTTKSPSSTSKGSRKHKGTRKTTRKPRKRGKKEAEVSLHPKHSSNTTDNAKPTETPLDLKNTTTAKIETVTKIVKVIKMPAKPTKSNKKVIKKIIVVAKPRKKQAVIAVAQKNPAKDPTTIYNITLIAHVTKSPGEIDGSLSPREGGASTGPQTFVDKILSEGLKGINSSAIGKNGQSEGKKIANLQSNNTSADNMLMATAKPTLQANDTANKLPETSDIRRIYQEVVETVWKRGPLRYYDLPPLNHTYNASKLAPLKEINPWKDMQNSLRQLESGFQLLWYFSWQNKSLPDNFTDVDNCEQLFGNATAWLRDIQKLRSNFYSNTQLIEKSKMSPEGLQFLITFTSEISLLELKGNLLTEFALVVLNVNNGQSVKPGYEFQHRYQKSVLESDKAMCPIMETTTKMYFRADPEEHILDTTYTALYRMMFGFVENEKNFPKNEQCLSKCDDMYQSTSPTCSSVSKCSSIKNVTSVEECLSENPHRVFDYATVNPKTAIWGAPTGDCSSKKEINATQVEGNSCDNCMCLCDEENELADRYISMVTSMADMGENNVVTGVRLIKHKRVIKLQIQQGRLSPNGIILNDTVAWKPLGESSIEKAYNLSYLRRRLHLDDIRQKGHFAVTGLRFRQYNVFYGLEVRFTPYNYFTGQLNNSASSWLQMSHYRNRQEINITSPDIPTRAASNKMDERKLLYVNFDVTDRDKDFSQTTIPYLDTQEVKPVKPTPLSGVGIYYKGSEGYGGFVGLKVFTTIPHPFDCSPQ